MTLGYRSTQRGYGRHTSRTPFASPRAEDVWGRLAEAVQACADGQTLGPGVWEALKTARVAACGAAFPVQGEAAKAASNALLEMTRTWSLAGEDQRGWHAASALALAAQCAALLGQHLAAYARRITGERD